MRMMEEEMNLRQPAVSFFGTPGDQKKGKENNKKKNELIDIQLTDAGTFRTERNVVDGRVTSKTNATFANKLDRVPDSQQMGKTHTYSAARTKKTTNCWTKPAVVRHVPVFDGRQGNDSSVPHVAHVA